MSNNKLDKQYDWFESFYAKHGHSPSTREFGAGIGLSHAMAHNILRKFEELGWVEIPRIRNRMIARAVKPIRAAEHETDEEGVSHAV